MTDAELRLHPAYALGLQDARGLAERHGHVYDRSDFASGYTWAADGIISDIGILESVYRTRRSERIAKIMGIADPCASGTIS